jgi:hypothetical protein
VTPRALKLLAPLLVLILGAADAPDGPAYNDKGEILPPANYREWVYMSSGLDMSYNPTAMAMGGSVFDNVFVDPASWRAFKATGHWPDKTRFVLEVRAAQSKGSINQHGHYQAGAVVGAEMHVRDDARFKGGWAFFSLNGDKPGRLIPATADCYACHLAHGAVDTTFTQFYPTARPIAEKAGTFQDR